MDKSDYGCFEYEYDYGEFIFIYKSAFKFATFFALVRTNHVLQYYIETER